MGEQPRLVVIGASAGGIEVLQAVVRDLPEALPAAVMVVVHVPAAGANVLADILDRAGPLPVRNAVDGEAVVPGTVLVAPAAHHLVLREHSVGVVRGPRENGHRPAVDPLFRSAARWFGSRVIGAVLSGGLDDGTAGLAAIRATGGIAVVQDPRDALHPSMPSAALERTGADHVATAAQLASLLTSLVAEEPPGPGAAPSPALVTEVQQVELELGLMHDEQHPGTPAGYSCPDCKGTLYELDDRDILRFRCRVGHAWSADALVVARDDELDDALWTALRALEEQVSLTRRLAQRAERRDSGEVAERFRQQANRAETRAATIRHVLLRSETDGAPDVALDGRGDGAGDGAAPPGWSAEDGAARG